MRLSFVGELAFTPSAPTPAPTELQLVTPLLLGAHTELQGCSVLRLDFIV